MAKPRKLQPQDISLLESFGIVLSWVILVFIKLVFPLWFLYWSIINLEVPW